LLAVGFLKSRVNFKIVKMEAKKKAVQLVKITFEKVANASNYKGVQKDGGKQFGIIEDLSKKIALDFVNEMIKEFEKSDSLYATNFLANYWKDVKSEIVGL
jgi:hypothetical protein